jgi:hypothetical protein
MEMKDAVKYVNEKHSAMYCSHDGINIMIPCYTMLYGLPEWNTCLRETYCLNLLICYPKDEGGVFLQHTGTNLPNDAAHTTEGCNPKSEELLHTIRVRPDTVTENDYQLIRHSLHKKKKKLCSAHVCLSIHHPVSGTKPFTGLSQN